MTGARGDRRIQAKRFLESEDDSKWNSLLPHMIGSKRFVQQVLKQTDDPKLKTHIQALHDLHHGKVMANVGGSSGKTYDVRQLPGGNLGCTCQDWRFRGSVDPSYECKHIKAFKEGKTKVASHSPFAAQMTAFARELSKILSDERMSADKPWLNAQGEFTDTPDRGTDLTRLEEPLAPLYAERDDTPQVLYRNGILT